MSALFCLPKREQSSVLNALEVRCLVDPVEIARWNDLVCKHHYLENANLVGEQFGPIGCLRPPEGDSRIARQFTAGFALPIA